MTAFSGTCQGVIAIDGKALRRSFDRASGKSALHMVSAWGCEQRMVLAQIATDAKSNEITAVPELLKMLSLKDTITTAGALLCQRAIASQIVGQGGDYAQALVTWRCPSKSLPHCRIAAVRHEVNRKRCGREISVRPVHARALGARSMLARA